MIARYFTVIKNENHRHTFFIFTILVICFCKLFLIGTNEIISVPNDSVNYVHLSHDFFGELGAPPGYPYWLALSTYIGCPQRVAIEVLYLFASVVGVNILVRVIGRFFALLLFGILAFLPATFFLFDNALCDGFFTCLTLIALALSISTILDSDYLKLFFWVRLLVLALIFGWMLITRNEDYLVTGWVLWLVVCRFFFQKQNRQQKEGLREAILSLVLLLFGAFSVAGSVSIFHFVTEGVFARTIATLPSHMDLLLNLASVETDAPSINRVPITNTQRELAYRASPTLKKLRGRIEDPKNMYQLASSKAGLPDREIGAGFVWHVFNDAAIQALPYKTLKDLNKFYLNANLELSQAFEHGTLKKKFVLHPLFGGDLNNFLFHFPESTITVYSGLFKVYGYQSDSGYESKLFDSACLRRTSLIDLQAYSGLVQGWAYVDHADSLISTAEVCVYEKKNSKANMSCFATETIPRPDVIQALVSGDQVPSQVFGFRLTLPRVLGDTVVMRYFLSDQSYLLTPPLVAGKASLIKLDSSDRIITQGIDSIGGVDFTVAHNNARHKFQVWLADAFGNIFQYLLSIILLITTIAIVLNKKIIEHNQTKNQYLAITILIVGLFVQRFLFYVMVDAVGWDIEVRYLTSALVLMVVVSVVLLAFSFHTFNQCRLVWFQRNLTKV